MLKKRIAIAAWAAVSLSAHADFSGDFAHANWTSQTQAYGCGGVPSSSSIVTSPATITFETQGNCAAIGVWYTIAVPKSGTISFDWTAVTGAGSTFAEYLINGVGTDFTVGQASGATSFSVQAGQELTLHYGGYTNSQFVVSNFNFAPLVVSVAPTPVTGAGTLALALGGMGIVASAGLLARRRRVR